MLRSEKGQHLDMPLVDYHKVWCVTPALACTAGTCSLWQCSMQAFSSGPAICVQLSAQPDDFNIGTVQLCMPLMWPVTLAQAAALVMEPISSETWMVVDGEKVLETAIALEFRSGICM